MCVHACAYTHTELEKKNGKFSIITCREAVFHCFNTHQSIKAMPGIKRFNNINVLHLTLKIPLILNITAFVNNCES